MEESMNIRDLMYFNDLAKTRNFTETAQNFYVSQPTITLALKRLESEFNTNLFDRQRFSKTMTITETGKLVLAFSTKTTKQLEITKKKIMDADNQEVSFGFLPTIGGSLWPYFIPLLKGHTKHISFHEEESSDKMLDLVTSGEVPIAIFGHPKPRINQENIVQIPLIKQAFTLWAKPNHPLAKKKRVSVADLKGETFLSLSKGYTHERIFNHWLMKNDLVEDINILYTQEIRTALSIASTSDMLAFMAPILIDGHGDLVEIPIENPPYFYISLAYNGAEKFGRYQQDFNEEMANIAENLHEEFSNIKDFPIKNK